LGSGGAHPAGCVLPPRVHQCRGRGNVRPEPAQLGKLDITVTRIGFKPFIGGARIGRSGWVSGCVTRIIHQHGSAHRSLVQLHLDSAIDGDLDRAW